MPDETNAERRKAVMARACHAAHRLRSNIDIPKEEGDRLLDVISDAEREMLPLLQAEGLRNYRYGGAGGYGSFYVVTAESTDTCEFVFIAARRRNDD